MLRLERSKDEVRLQRQLVPSQQRDFVWSLLLFQIDPTPDHAIEWFDEIGVTTT